MILIDNIYNRFCGCLKTLTNGVKTLTNGVKTLTNGVKTLTNRVKTLTNRVKTLTNSFDYSIYNIFYVICILSDPQSQNHY
ncbi:hypothetical protein JYT44_02365 [Caldithrix abyssi]|nr:hypothetical protein [Caldithrix abyssi]